MTGSVEAWEMQPPLLGRLDSCSSVLLMGAGGGYDVFCGLPLAHYLKSRGKKVHLGSLHFTGPRPSWGRELADGLVEVSAPELVPPRIGAETCLAMWLQGRGEAAPVYCFAAAGVQRVLAHYRFLKEHLDLDALVLVDGGTDCLLRGDEPGLGSPGEDVVSLAAAHLLELETRLVASLGFGLDAHHHVCHAYVLEAAAELTASGSFLGAFSLLSGMAEFEYLRQAVEFASSRPEARASIITGSVVAAAQGHFGNHHATPRTQGSELFLNPLMSMYWGFEVDGLARRNLYLERLLETRERGEVTRLIQQFRSSLQPRPWKQLPM